ncbi:hypothetical protein GCM10025868_37990 [Angustibacter aerolatus]|uniref:Peptidase S33 tripeptidyl aminopeptidase-like C-terminal domain-containing protein n=1 Tax=Angustibacter aerolatus TaxID=1162965 RepID=A0ABQ6JN55_9ACTN|nr:hypothetical protein GCM10025868_37990 [Angustibacter aerolatus]
MVQGDRDPFGSAADVRAAVPAADVHEVRGDHGGARSAGAQEVLRAALSALLAGLAPS